MTSSSATASSVVVQKLDKPRPHTCTTCLRAFARLEHLKRHERSHTKEKPFECPVCERRFARRDLLLRHQQKLHTGLATTRQRQPRKNSITVATLGRPRKEPPSRPRANTFSGPSPTGIGLGLDSTASTNSWLESTFGKGIAGDTGSAAPAWYIGAGASDNGDAADVNADASSPKATLFGSLYINPDLLPFTLPDNKALGLTTDEDALEFDEDFWLGSLSVASPVAATSSGPGAAPSSAIPPRSARPDDYASPVSYDTPASTTSTVSSVADNIKPEPGVNMHFAFPPAEASPGGGAGGDFMSRAHMQSQVEAQRRNSPGFDDNTISPSLLLDHHQLHQLYSEMSIDPLATFDAQPSPTPSMTSTTSRSSNVSSANTSIATSSPPIEHGSLPVVKRHSSMPIRSPPLPSRSNTVPASRKTVASTISPEMLFAGQAPNALLNTLSARSAFAPNPIANDTHPGDFTSDLFSSDLPVFTTMSQLHLKDQATRSMF
ncbi:hypothetical protein V1517DRAFT_333644 [Lipomyces orientalis]|uniref:Uncharacterized protein n=1 Tax=Lipomyces orientalis TaxID=1233043 RepID=A0ACC3TDQ7_9ASCO